MLVQLLEVRKVRVLLLKKGKASVRKMFPSGVKLVRSTPLLWRSLEAREFE